MSYVFKPEDFKNKDTDVFLIEPEDAQIITDIANAKLEEWLKDAQVVYGKMDDCVGMLYGLYGSCGWTIDISHKAKLVCIEKMK